MGASWASRTLAGRAGSACGAGASTRNGRSRWPSQPTETVGLEAATAGRARPAARRHQPGAGAGRASALPALQLGLGHAQAPGHPELARTRRAVRYPGPRPCPAGPCPAGPSPGPLCPGGFVPGVAVPGARVLGGFVPGGFVPDGSVLGSLASRSWAPSWVARSRASWEGAARSPSPGRAVSPGASSRPVALPAPAAAATRPGSAARSPSVSPPGTPSPPPEAGVPPGRVQDRPLVPLPAPARRLALAARS